MYTYPSFPPFPSFPLSPFFSIFSIIQLSSPSFLSFSIYELTPSPSPSPSPTPPPSHPPPLTRTPLSSPSFTLHRRNAVGDQLRAVYDQLARDPNSLANLDQDLPNYAQHIVPIHSLPQVTSSLLFSSLLIASSSNILSSNLPLFSSSPHLTSSCSLYPPIFLIITHAHSSISSSFPLYFLSSLFQEWLWCETWCSDDSKVQVHIFKNTYMIVTIIVYCYCCSYFY